MRRQANGNCVLHCAPVCTVPLYQNCRVGYLEQEPQLDAGATVADNIQPAVQHIKWVVLLDAFASTGAVLMGASFSVCKAWLLCT